MTPFCQCGKQESAQAWQCRYALAKAHPLHALSVSLGKPHESIDRVIREYAGGVKRARSRGSIAGRGRAQRDGHILPRPSAGDGVMSGLRNM